MANSQRAYVGAAACPRNIKLGTKVKIAGKTYTCADRTAKRYDGRFDIFAGYTQADHDRAVQSGVKKLNVKIL